MVTLKKTFNKLVWKITSGTSKKKRNFRLSKWSNTELQQTRHNYKIPRTIRESYTSKSREKQRPYERT